ncbi:hypothetical protein [Ectopseudomonas mendocina]|uniref:hypothetical protein n=1 Tax=Ectopseudomonas mendocina TaxID=300 RepID=UPI0023EB1FDC|nr:hypothetical protein [Pseudomonas mendocina]
MQRISGERLQALMRDSRVLEQDGLGPKVLRLQDNSFLKLFRKRRLLSSETLKPYAERFADNSKQLQRLGFIAPQIIGVYRIESDVNGTAVHYLPLPGETLRKSLEQAQPEQRHLLINLFGQLLGRLHEQGVYFRSVHLGNVLVLPNGALGLIDVADMKFGRRPLSLSMRQRNLKHMRRYEQDAQWLFNMHKDALSDGYRQCAPRFAQLLKSE